MKKERFTAYRDTDYMYCSSLSRAKEKYIIGKEGLYRLIDSEPRAILAEYGYLPGAKDGASPEERDRSLGGTVALRFDEIEEALPRFDGETLSVVTPLRYPYDCNNLKAMLKCSIMGISAEGMLFESGTLPIEALAAILSGELKETDVKPNRKSRAKGLPDNMVAAAKEARERYAATKDPRVIDLMIDRACYADMLEAANAMGIPFLTEYVKLKIDATNILTALRIEKMYGANRKLADDALSKALLGGGSLDLSAAGGGIEAIVEAIRGDARFERLASAIAGGLSLSDAEKMIDGVVSELIVSAKRAAFGAEVPIGYLLGLEISVKNVRIVLAGKDAGLDSALIRERMRENYV